MMQFCLYTTAIIWCHSKCMNTVSPPIWWSVVQLCPSNQNWWAWIKIFPESQRDSRSSIYSQSLLVYIECGITNFSAKLDFICNSQVSENIVLAFFHADVIQNVHIFLRRMNLSSLIISSNAHILDICHYLQHYYYISTLYTLSCDPHVTLTTLTFGSDSTTQL